MRLINPYRSLPRWFRGNTHAHTTLSDGDTPVSELLAAYRERGYDFIAITDHDVVSTASSEDACPLLLLSSSEVTVQGRFHVCALGVGDAVSLSRHASTPQEAIEMIRRSGALPILSHPEWSHLSDDLILPLQNVGLLEIANAVCNRLEFNGFAVALWDRLLRRGRMFWGVAADDAHRGRYDVGRAWVVVNADRLNAADILENIGAGNFYSSMGPAIHSVEVDGQRIRVRTSAVIEGRFRGASLDPLVTILGDGVSQFDYTVEGHEQYVRFECVDELGLGAWTNPVCIQAAP